MILALRAAGKSSSVPLIEGAVVDIDDGEHRRRERLDSSPLPVRWRRPTPKSPSCSRRSATLIQRRYRAARERLGRSRSGHTPTVLVLAEINLVDPSHAALSACREAAQRTRKEQHCTIVVPAA